MSNIFFYEPFYDLDRLLDDSWVTRGGNNSGSNNQQVARQDDSGRSRAFRPKMDLHEDTDKNLVTASFELPGVPKDNINIQSNNGRLTVSAETSSDESKDENGYAVRERRYGKYSRTLQLPQGVKESDIKAGMDNGILTVTFPRTTPELAPKKITIS